MAVTLGWTITASGEAKNSMVRDLALDAVSHDFVLANGDLQLVAGGEAIAQSARIALKMGRGEWFLDLDGVYGVPYLQSIFQKQQSPLAVASIFRTVLEALPGIREVSQVRALFDSGTRRLRVEFDATSDVGELVGVGEEEAA